MFPKSSIAFSLLTLPLVIGFSKAQGLPTTCRDTKNFTQAINHASTENDTNSGTFQQQYQLDLSAYKPGGPILFFQGNEATSMFCIEGLILPSWAKELGAAVATLEHRFFGQSVPSNSTDPKTRFKTLTLDNVMLDSVSFIEWVKANVPGAKKSKAIVQGASYGASLSTWLRLNHPETFYGAISSAPALRSLNPPLNDPVNYNWQSHISEVYSYQSAAAAARIKNAFVALEEQIASVEGRAKLQAEYNLCAPVNSTAYGAVFLSFLQTVYGFASQFNFASVQRPLGDRSVAVGFNVTSPLQAVINKTLALPANDTTGILNATLQLYYQQFPGCVDSSTGSPTFPGIESSVFNYITCQWLPLKNVAIPPEAIFPAVPADSTAGFAQFCQSIYGVEQPTQAELQKQYHFTQADIQNSTRVLIASGQFDPASAVGPKDWDFSPNSNASRVLSVVNMAHCEDTYKAVPSDKATVIEARNYELQMIKAWLGMTD